MRYSMVAEARGNTPIHRPLATPVIIRLAEELDEPDCGVVTVEPEPAPAGSDHGAGSDGKAADGDTFSLGAQSPAPNGLEEDVLAWYDSQAAGQKATTKQPQQPKTRKKGGKRARKKRNAAAAGGRGRGSHKRVRKQVAGDAATVSDDDGGDVDSDLGAAPAPKAHRPHHPHAMRASACSP